MNANEFLTWGIWLRHIEPNLATKKKDLDVTRWGRAGRNPAIREPSLGQRDFILLQPKVLFKCKGYGTWRGREKLFTSLLKERQTYVHEYVLEGESCHDVKEKGFLLSLEK